MSSIFDRRATQSSPAQAILVTDLTRASRNHTLDLRQISTPSDNFYEVKPPTRKQDSQIDSFLTRKLSATSTAVEEDGLDFYEFALPTAPVTRFSAWKDSIAAKIRSAEKTLKKVAGYRFGWSVVAAMLLVSTITFIGFRYMAVSAAPSPTTTSTMTTQGNLSHASQPPSSTSTAPAHNNVAAVKSDAHIEPVAVTSPPTVDTPAFTITNDSPPVVQPEAAPVPAQPAQVTGPSQTEPVTSKVAPTTDSGNSSTVTQSCSASNNSCSVANVVSSTTSAIGTDKSASVPLAPVLSQPVSTLTRVVSHVSLAV